MAAAPHIPRVHLPNAPPVAAGSTPAQTGRTDHSADPDAFIKVLYRSAGDGWRVGYAHNITNTSTVFVTDARTGLAENVRPSDVVDPRVAVGLSEEDTDRLLATAELDTAALEESAARHRSGGDVSGAAHPADASTASASAATDCIAIDDLAALRPSPLLLMGSSIDTLRCRHRHMRRRLLSGEPEESTTVSTFVGDNVAYVIRSVPPSGIVQRNGGPSPLARRVFAALKATSAPQVIVAASDASPFGEAMSHAYDMALLLSAPAAVANKIAAAMTIIQSFTHDVYGRQHALTEVALLATEADHSYRAANINVAMVDGTRIADQPFANWEIVGFLGFALSAEEKERCYLPTRKTAKPPACLAPELATDVNLVDRLRERYFVFCEALETMQFEVHLQLFVFARVAAAMHFLDVGFDADGTLSNMAALRNAAKLISADFNSLSKIITNRQHCVAAARFLYSSTLRFIVSKLGGKLNEVGAQDGLQGVRSSVTLLSAFAPDHPTGHLHTGANDVLPLHHLFRNAFFEDITQRFYLSTERELAQWQDQGFVVPANLQAALDPFDNYAVVKLLKAKGGVLAAMEAATTILLPCEDVNSKNAGGAEEPSADVAQQAAEDAANAGDDEDDAPIDNTPYFVPDRDAAAKIRYAAIPPGQETDADKPPKKAMPPQDLPVRNDNLAMMAFIFASEIIVSNDVSGTKLESGGEYILTIGPSGNATMWRKEKPVWAGNIATDFVGMHVSTSFDATMQLRPSGAKSKPTNVELRLHIRKSPDDAEPHNDQMNVLVRACLQLAPKASVTYTPKPVEQAPPPPAEDREEEEAERRRKEAEEAAAAAAAAAPDAVARANREKALADFTSLFSRLARRRGVKYDEISNTISVEHSFGWRTYCLPPRTAAGAASAADIDGVAPWLTVLAPAFDSLRAYMLAECDVETQEALYSEDQGLFVVTTAARYRQELDNVIATTLTRPNARFWFCIVATLADGNFNGELVEQHLRVGLFQSVRTLRVAVPRSYLAVSTDYIADGFISVLPPPKRRLFRAEVAKMASDAAAVAARTRVYCEEVCIAANASHVMSRTGVLIDAGSLLALDEAVSNTRNESAIVVQRCARAAGSSLVVQRRLDSMATAVTRDEEERNAVIAMRKWQLDHAAQVRQHRINLQEEEFNTRRAVAEECWIEWVAMQTQVQAELEDAIQNIVASRLHARQHEIKQAERKSQQVAVRALTSRIQSRILQQGTQLDQMVHKHLLNDGASRERLEKLRFAHEKLLRAKECTAEQRASLEHKLFEKSKRVDVVAQQREERRNQMREELWHRQERERVVREQIERNRAVLEERLREDMVVDRIGFEMSRRTKMELIERQNAHRDELRRQFEEDRRKQEEAMARNAKKQWSQSVKQVRALSQQRDMEKERKRKERIAQWQAQERERAAAARAKQEEADRQKSLTRKLLKAHSLLCTPMLFEQTAKGEQRLVVAPTANGSSSARRSRSITGPDLEGFAMSTGHRTYSRMLPERVWDGVIEHHERSLLRDGSIISPSINRSASRNLNSSARLRDASPRSVHSL